MDTVLASIDQELSTLVDNISRYELIEDQVERIVDLDKETLKALENLKLQYEACKRLEALQYESRRLDKAIEDTLVGLADCRRQLESNIEILEPASVDVDTLLNYATKITKFTHQQPGSEGTLPWPTEDHIRRGMLATLAVQQEAQPEEPEAVPMEEEIVEKPKERGPVLEQKPREKINLDLFDSDDE